MIDYAKILAHKYAGKEYTLNGDTYEGLIWLSDTPKPTKAILDVLWAEMQAEIVNAKTAKQNARQAVFDKLGLTADEAAALLG